MSSLQTKGVSTPEVFITSNKNRHKIYKNNTVFLENGENFEIELFNNQNEDVGFKILINDKDTSGDMLILRPGERFHLDRFLETNKKFLFDTYNVDKNDEQAQKAIENNGKVRVEVYKEKQNKDVGQKYYYTSHAAYDSIDQKIGERAGGQCG